MAGELDQFLNEIKIRKKNKEEEEQTLNIKRSAFHTSFKETLSAIIHPTMIDLCKKLRDHGHDAIMLREKVEMKYAYENYKIDPSGSGNKYAVISVVGNYDLQKVCITTEYLLFNPNSKPASVSKTEQQFELAQITPEIFEPMVVKVLTDLIVDA